MNKYKKNQTGVILLLTLFILFGILVITLGAADLVLNGLKMNRLTGYSSLAFYASEAGLERSLWEARKNPFFTLPNEAEVKPIFPSIPPEPVNSKVILNNDSAYVVDYASSTPIVTFKSIGSYLGVKRSVESAYEVE